MPACLLAPDALCVCVGGCVCVWGGVCVGGRSVAIHKAAVKGQKAACEWLLDPTGGGLGAVQLQADGDGNTPAEMARLEGYTELALWLERQQQQLHDSSAAAAGGGGGGGREEGTDFDCDNGL